MKKILSLGIILVILTNSMGYYVIFEINRYFIRKEMRETNGAGKKIFILEIPDPMNDEKILWTDKHELIVNNHLYDVIYTYDQGNKILIYCYRDLKEENLLDLYQKANSSKITQALWHLLSKMASTCCSFESKSVSCIEYSFPVLIPRISRMYNPPGSPPPKIPV